jgi:hypothetical protein
MTKPTPHSEAGFTPGPWYIRDFRASEMQKLGWNGPSIDSILITNKTGPEIEASSGADCVIARIQFDNRTEQLTEGNFADARLIAAAPDLYLWLEDALGFIEHLVGDQSPIINFTRTGGFHRSFNMDKAKAALSAVGGE